MALRQTKDGTREQLECLIKNSKSKVLMVDGVNYEVLPSILSKL